MSQHLGFEVELPFAFKHEGFGILTEIDLRAAFHEKLVASSGHT